ncbi:MAG: hypothetical protein GKS05_03720 [Nitrospirales bacterium]|nr:hypothetical protein [Nitrospirales bacterium]
MLEVVKLILARIVWAFLGIFYRLLKVLGICLMVSGPLVLLYQVFFWLHHGTWRSYSLYGTMAAGLREIPKSWVTNSELLTDLQHWVEKPEVWEGLHMLLVEYPKVIPLALVLFFIGGIVGSRMSNSADQRLKQFEKPTGHKS